jgi:hypothetical protein
MLVSLRGLQTRTVQIIDEYPKIIVENVGKFDDNKKGGEAVVELIGAALILSQKR